MNGWARRLTGATVGLSLVFGLSALGTSTPATGAPQAPQTRRASETSSARAAKVSKVSKKITKTDKIKTPKLHWYKCFEESRQYCAVAKVPRDYDKPKGAKVELALLKVTARKPKQRIGSLFVNPGGPAGSATELASYADTIFSDAILDRFDIVGMDPRGVGFSDNAQCFANQGKQDSAFKGFSVYFPMSTAEYKPYLRSVRALGKACSKKAGLAHAMSTAQVVRDMEMMRRAVKDKKLNYYGMSYGSYLGTVYANMYPSRFRAIAIDGVINPKAWAATSAKSRRLPREFAMQSGRGGYRAYQQILTLCDRAGVERCPLAAGGAWRKAKLVADRLRKASLVVRDDDGEILYVYSYADYVSDLLSALYAYDAPDYVAYVVQDTYELYYPPASSDERLAGLIRAHKAMRAKVSAFGRQPRLGFPYENEADAYTAIACTDSREKTRLKKYPTYAKNIDRSGPLFGRYWLWSNAQCAGDVFNAEDEDAYRGPFNRRTKAPVLVIGSFWDPATNYASARATASLLGNARLLPNNGYGHTSYGESPCVTKAIDSYLITGKARSSYATCRTTYQPFLPTDDDDEERAKTDARSRLLAKIARGKR